MTAQQLGDWQDRHSLSLSMGADLLGISRSAFKTYLSGAERIPLIMARFCWAMDYIMLQSGHHIMPLERPGLQGQVKAYKGWGGGAPIDYNSKEVPLVYPSRDEE